MLCKAADEVPEGYGWRYEPKWDGFRGVLENAGGGLLARLVLPLA